MGVEWPCMLHDGQACKKPNLQNQPHPRPCQPVCRLAQVSTDKAKVLHMQASQHAVAPPLAL